MQRNLPVGFHSHYRVSEEDRLESRNLDRDEVGTKWVKLREPSLEMIW